MTESRSARLPAQRLEARNGFEAIARVERAICGDAVAHEQAVAEGLALCGTRAASLAPGSAAGAPGGRALAEDDRVEVAWTVSTPADDRIPDRMERRRHRLLRLVAEAAEQGGSPTVEDIATALGASPATVRRDLSALRSQGHEVQTRGTRHSGTG